MKKMKTIQAINMEFYKTRIFEERPKWDKSWSENVNYSDASSEEAGSSGRKTVRSWQGREMESPNQKHAQFKNKQTNKTNGQEIEPKGYMEHCKETKLTKPME